MTERVQAAVETLKPVDPYALFPELNEDIDRRILHSEQRIKYWVVFGILMNLTALMVTAVPAVFYMGQLSRDASTIASNVQKQDVRFDRIRTEMVRSYIWRNSAEEWMRGKGYNPPILNGDP